MYISVQKITKTLITQAQNKPNSLNTLKAISLYIKLGWSCEYIQVKWANLEEVRVRRRKRGKEVRGDEKGQPFTCGKKKTRCLYWVWKVAQLDHPCPCTSIAPCFHCKLHALSRSLSLSLSLLYLRETTKSFSFLGKAVEEKRWVLLLKSNPLFCSVLFCLFETLNRLLNPIGT